MQSTLTWQQLFSSLRPILTSAKQGLLHEHQSKAILSLLSRYNSSEEDFHKYVFFDMNGYTKNLVEEFGFDCNVIIMCWAAGQSSAFHAHEGSKCFVKVLRGELLEQQVPYPSSKSEVGLECGKESLLRCNDVTYIDDSIGLHKVTNRYLDRSAITLHIYLPAYTSCRIFEPNSYDSKLSLDRSTTFDVGFHSRMGQSSR